MLTECSAEKKGMHTGTHTWIQGKDKKKKKKRGEGSALNREKDSAIGGTQCLIPGPSTE